MTSHHVVVLITLKSAGPNHCPLKIIFSSLAYLITQTPTANTNNRDWRVTIFSLQIGDREHAALKATHQPPYECSPVTHPSSLH